MSTRAGEPHWAGRGFQPQNLPRGAEIKLDADFDAAVDAALARDLAGLEALATKLTTTVPLLLASLVRACVVAPRGQYLGVVDFKSIEPRVLMWLANDREGLEPYAEGRDVYALRAADLYGVPLADVTHEMRALGKALEIGCGYQMGAARFESYAELFGVDWTRAGFTAEQALRVWRLAHPAIAGRPSTADDGHAGWFGGFWRTIEAVAIRAACGERLELGPLLWYRDDDAVVCRLPSGRPLIYRNARVESVRTPWGSERPQFTYDHGGQRRSSYGGKLTENVVQAIARDMLAAALVRLELEKLPPVLHVHDEVVSELPERDALEDMERLMCITPPWATGLPLAASAHVASRYRK